MKIRTLALGGVAMLLAASPGYARTSHPATPEEIAQTDALNAQALVNARAGIAADRSMAGADVHQRPMTAPTAVDSTAPTTGMTAPNNDATTPDNNGNNVATPVPGASTPSGSMTPPNQPTPTMPESSATPPTTPKTNGTNGY